MSIQLAPLFDQGYGLFQNQKVLARPSTVSIDSNKFHY